MRSVPFVEELTPAPDCWEIAQRLSHRPHLLFLDSSDRHSPFGRYSFIATDPTDWIEIPKVDFGGVDPFHILSRRLSGREVEKADGLPPFQGGLAGLFGYGLGHAFERFPRPAHDDFRVPDVAVGTYEWVIAFDHLQDRAWIVSQTPAGMGTAKRLLTRTPAILRDQASRPLEVVRQFALPQRPSVTSNFSRDSYLETVRRTVDYIHAGDCFQVNIAQRLLSQYVGQPFELYRRLRERSPSPFAGYFDLGDFCLASASPERFLNLKNRDVESRPIKGTRPRGQTPEQDAAIASQLAASIKDRAENVMIVDLLRNDLGRVCEYGSIHVPQVCGVETYRHIHHLVSAVQGQLRADQSPFDLLRATFPGGSVTGAPKVRALEIISELEPTERGAYCGCLGYIGFDGAMDVSILIRTFTIGKGWVQFPVGGGIVADSDPENEYEETLHKAAGMLAALD